MKKMKKGLHPRSLHLEKYDFEKLMAAQPKLSPFVSKNKYGDLSVDFSNPKAVLALNQALLSHFYQIEYWDIPKDHLCPPVPGRSDYLHYIADLLAENNGGEIPRGKNIRGLDIGVGASCIYPILGNRLYGWKFLGSDIISSSVKFANLLINANPSMKTSLECRLQKDPFAIFNSIINSHDKFNFTMCNPPFHSSLEKAKAANARKNRNLGKGNEPQLNFGGKASELWCDGGEAEFIIRMIKESQVYGENCIWFTTLVSQKDNLPKIYSALKRAKVKDQRTIEMQHGQKLSRIVGWSFL